MFVSSINSPSSAGFLGRDRRVAFCGASGTGKTTLAKWVEAETGVPFNPVGSRSVAKVMGFDNPYDVDKAGKRKEFQQRLLTEKLEWEREHSSFVVDRTTLDNLVYTMFHDIYAIDHEVFQAAKKGLARYTHIIYCPVEVFCKTGTDGNRVGGGEYGTVGDNTYHELFDTVIKAMLAKHCPTIAIRALNLRVKGLDERKAEVGGFLEL